LLALPGRPCAAVLNDMSIQDTHLFRAGSGMARRPGGCALRFGEVVGEDPVSKPVG
jgi:hypothetical protein